VLGPLLFCSGAAALAYETLWIRDWALYYGATATGTAVVLASYFAGLAFGAEIGGRLARPESALVRYARLELAVAVAMLGYLALRPALPAIADAVTLGSPPALVPVTRTLLAMALLGLPTLLIGATLPVLASSCAPGDARAVGRLYAWNTLGGAAGVVATSFWGIRTLGMSGTFLAAIAVTMAVAVTAARLARRVGATPASRRTSRARVRPAARVVGVAAVAGFVGLATEVLWTRGLAGVLSNSVYSVGVVLAVMLVGIVGGAATAVWLLGRPTRVATLLAVTMMGLGLSVAVSPRVLHAIPAVAHALRTAVGGGAAAEALLATMVLALPALLLGVAFPLAVALAGVATPGATTGRLLAANTAGGIAGALVAAFVLLPALGLPGGLLVSAGVAFAGAALIADALPMRIAAGVAAGGLAVVASMTPHAPVPWQRAAGERVLFARDGATASVVVTEIPGHGRRLRINGQYSLGGTDGLLLERREALLPLLLHPAPRRLLHIGVGTGDTLGAAVAHPGLDVDGVELVDGALEGARLFAAENRGVLDHPRARVRAADARTVLRAATAHWDVVVSDLFLPWASGATALYSRDFYELGRARLAPGGLFCQWLPLHQLPPADLEAIVASFVDVFPVVTLWVAYHRTPTPLAALVGSDGPLAADLETIRARLADPTLRAMAASVGLDEPVDLAVLYVADGEHLRLATRDVVPITDDRPRLAFSAPGTHFGGLDPSAASLAWVAARLDPGPAPIAGAPAVPFAARASLLAAQLSLLAGDGPGELGELLAALEAAPHVRATRQALDAIARARRQAGDPRTAAFIGEALRRSAAPVAAADVAGG